MIPKKKPSLLSQLSIPRESGDDPGVAKFAANMERYSPRERG